MTLHLFKDSDSCASVFVSDTEVEQAVVKDLIWLVAEVRRPFIHLINKFHHSTHTVVMCTVWVTAILVPVITVRFDSFNQTGQSVVVGFDVAGFHLGEERPSVVLSAATHVHFDQGVKSDLIWIQTHSFHQLEQIVRFIEEFLDSASFQERVKGHFIRSHE